MDLDPTSEDTGAAHEGGGAPTPLGRAPCLVGAPVAPPTYFLHPYISSYPKTSKNTIDREFRRQKPP